MGCVFVCGVSFLGCVVLCCVVLCMCAHLSAKQRTVTPKKRPATRKTLRPETKRPAAEQHRGGTISH